MALCLRQSGKASTRRVKTPEGLPTHLRVKVGDKKVRVPCSYFEKDAISTGRYRHPVTGRKFRVTPERMQRWVRTFKRMRQAGLEIPTPVDHSDRAEDNRGFVIDARVVESGGRETLRLTQQAIGRDAALLAARNRCSVFVDNYVDEHGRDWGEALLHSAYTPKPVISGHGEFQAFAASRAEGKRRIVPVYYQQQETEMTKLSKKTRAIIRKALGLKAADELPKGNDLVAALVAASKPKMALTVQKLLAKAAKANKKAKAEDGDEDDDLELDGDDAEGAEDSEDDDADGDEEDDDEAEDEEDDETPAVRSKPNKARERALVASRARGGLDRNTRMLLSRALRTEKKAVVARGYPPELVERLDRIFMKGKRPNALALSAVPGTEDPLYFEVLRSLQKTRPVPVTGGRTGSQERLSLARQTPGGSARDDKDLAREEKEARDYAKKKNARNRVPALD